MSLVTRCPACATTFKVVKDQLRISDGWVRCGRCSQVFDANDDLRETPDPVTALTGPSAAGPTTAVEPSEPSEHHAHGDAIRAAARDADIVFGNGGGASGSHIGVGQPTDEEAGIEPAHAEADRGGWVEDDDDFNDDLPPQDRLTESDKANEVAQVEADPEGSADESPASSTSRMSLAALFADTWPADRISAPPAPLVPAIPQYKSFPPFPSIDLSLPPAPAAKRFMRVSHQDAPTPEDESKLQDAGPLALPRSEEAEDSDDADLDPEATAPGTSTAVSQEPPDGEGAQLQKALRRARARSAKLARYKAREAAREKPPSDSQPFGDGAASLVMSTSEPEVQPQPAPSARAPVRTRTTRRRSRTRRIKTRFLATRAPWLAAAVIAGLLLVLQVLRFQRDLVVAHQPSWRPLLSALCSATGCELSALRRIGDIKIDGASFARERTGDSYRLSFTLRNVSAVDLAMPAIELSLLDLQERAVVRRVLMPADFNAPAVLPAHAERSASLPLSLAGPEASGLPPVAGFLVEALYP
ncbi:conserved hypothetical protein [Burkholderiales bacterium 8X]|nr:conserved hypothetical protein [Burkholderiales bacterium 8X]